MIGNNIAQLSVNGLQYNVEKYFVQYFEYYMIKNHFFEEIVSLKNKSLKTKNILVSLH